MKVISTVRDIDSAEIMKLLQKSTCPYPWYHWWLARHPSHSSTYFNFIFSTLISSRSSCSVIEVARFGEYINLLSKLSRCCRAWHWHHQASSINWKSLCGLWDNSDSWGSKLHLLQFFLVIMEYYQIRLVTHLIWLRLIPRIRAPRAPRWYEATWNFHKTTHRNRVPPQADI